MTNMFSGKAVPLTEQGFDDVNRRLGGNACTLWAIMTVETQGFGFFADRRPKILFERHWFHKLTHGGYDLEHPGISSAAPGGYLSGAAEYGRLEQAIALDPLAALDSASWGLGQIMGFNAIGLGYPGAADMVARFSASEDSQLDGMFRFIANNPRLDTAYRARDWATVARCYNGEAYARNEYDSKLAHYFEQYTASGTPSIEVRGAQARLTYLGFNPRGVDGVIGTATRKALAAFQQSRAIPVTAELDSQTLSALAAAAGT